MEEIGTTNRSTSHCEFNGVRSCTHTQKTILLTLIHPFTTQIVPSLYPQSFPSSSCRSLSPVFCLDVIKGFLPMNNIFTHVSFFLIILLSFSSHTFSWACGSLREPRKIFSFCEFTCLSNNSLIS